MARILITGGTGTVGNEIVRQYKGNLDELIVYSRNEKNQIEMMRKYPNIKYIIGDIRDYKAILRATENVETIYHLAAIKHIAICEEQPAEAFKTNIKGTVNILNAAKKNKCKVVFLSSDKAENPNSIYGCTKRIGEILTLNNNQCVIRSGNIFASSGSVIPYWISQVKNTNIIELTDCRMTRWFISVQELVKEILKEKTTGLYIPDKMKSYKMIDIAEYIAKTYGNKDTQIIITGGRPGERLYEYLGGESSENNTGNINDIKKLFNDTRTGILA